MRRRVAVAMCAVVVVAAGAIGRTWAAECADGGVDCAPVTTTIAATTATAPLPTTETTPAQVSTSDTTVTTPAETRAGDASTATTPGDLTERPAESAPLPEPPVRGAAPATAPGAPPAATSTTSIKTAPAVPTPRPAPDSTPALGGGPYVFPVFGVARFDDTFGAARADVSWHHGDDIFAPLGAPVRAVADGTLSLVGWNMIGGKRLWLRDRAGDYFYYAHLSAFAVLARTGVAVHAGDVLGYVGTTGDAAGTPPHLHFEIHPFGLLSLGYDGAVDPTSYLRAWQRSGAGVSAAGAAPPSSVPAVRPAVVAVASSDISSASGLDPRSLRRVLSRPLHLQLRPLASAPLTSSRENVTPPHPVDLVHERDAPGELPPDVAQRSVWDSIAECEAAGRWSTDTGNGFFGGLQFAPVTWVAFGGTDFAPTANLATREQQILVASRVLAAQGWRAWPVCSLALGLR